MPDEVARVSIAYVRELRSKIHLTEPPAHNPLVPHRREMLLDQTTFDAISDYTQSMPTAASEGRIWKRNLGWPEDMDDNWFVYLVINAPDGDGQLHVPYTPVIV